MKLYHGSKNIISHPIAYGSDEHNDYGPAFYLTKDLESAHAWACRNNSIGYVNVYELDVEDLKILDLANNQNYSVLNWLAILLHFRTLSHQFIKDFHSRLEFIVKNYYIDVEKYDLVIGYRADDAYFRFPLDFIRGNITLEQLESSFKLGELGIQYVIMSEKCISKIVFKKAFLSDKKYLNTYFDGVNATTNRYDDLNKDEEGTRILDIMRSKQ